MSDEVNAQGAGDAEETDSDEVTAHFAEDVDDDSPCGTNSCGVQFADEA